MSTANKGPRTVPTPSAKTKFNIDKASEFKRPVIDRIDITSLQIDESYDVECDPYNSTGQFLAEAVNESYDD